MNYKDQLQLVLNLVEEYGNLREIYGHNSENLLDFEEKDLNKKIGALFGSIETLLNCIEKK